MRPARALVFDGEERVLHPRRQIKHCRRSISATVAEMRDRVVVRLLQERLNVEIDLVVPKRIRELHGDIAHPQQRKREQEHDGDRVVVYRWAIRWADCERVRERDLLHEEEYIQKMEIRQRDLRRRRRRETYPRMPSRQSFSDTRWLRTGEHAHSAAYRLPE